MERTPRWLTFCCLVALLLVALPAVADHHQAGSEEHGEMEGEMEMSAEEAAMMAAWQKAMTPGEPHANLAGLAGDYHFEIKTWMDPEAPPMVSTGTAHREMPMGGRILVEEVEATVMGQPFKGHGETGYDNVKGEYWSTWTDNMSTGLMVSYGKWDDEAGGLVMHAEYVDVMTGETKNARMVSEVHDDGTEHFSWYDKTADGEQKTMAITYTKK